MSDECIQATRLASGGMVTLARPCQMSLDADPRSPNLKPGERPMNHTTAVVVLLQIAMLHWCGSAAHGDEPTDSLIDQLQSSDWDVEKRAARQLVALGAEAVAPLLAEGRSRYASRRGRAILVLGRIGPESRQATDIDRKSVV